MRTQRHETEMVNYWANKHEETADEMFACLDHYDDDTRNALAEHIEYLIDDVSFLREYAQNLRLNPR